MRYSHILLFSSSFGPSISRSATRTISFSCLARVRQFSHTPMAPTLRKRSAVSTVTVAATRTRSTVRGSSSRNGVVDVVSQRKELETETVMKNLKSSEAQELLSDEEGLATTLIQSSKLANEDNDDTNSSSDVGNGEQVNSKTKKGSAPVRRGKKSAAITTSEVVVNVSSVAASGSGGSFLESRNLDLKILIGAHVSAAGGVHNAVHNARHIGANAFALFLKSQRKWANPPLPDTMPPIFNQACSDHGYDASGVAVPHGSYLVNLATTTDKAKVEQAYASFRDDLTRCHRLGIRLYNFHPGSAVAAGGDREAALKQVAEQINRAHRDPETGEVVALIETMATAPDATGLGGKFEDLSRIISYVENKNRVGVCLDTCHVFAAGYDLRTKETYASTMEQFDRIIGLKYLRAIHLNDSKAPLASHRDLHANIGTGFLGLFAFWNVVNDRRLEGIPMVLETPIDEDGVDGTVAATAGAKKPKQKQEPNVGVWAREIKLLESLVGMDPESERFRSLEAELAKKGEKERAKHQAQMDEKIAKEKKKGERQKQKQKPEGSNPFAIAAGASKRKRASRGSESGSSEDGEGGHADPNADSEPDAKPKRQRAKRKA